MNPTPLKNTAIGFTAAQGTIASPQSTLKTPKNRLVARWLIDENSKLYCQWIREN